MERSAGYRNSYISLSPTHADVKKYETLQFHMGMDIACVCVYNHNVGHHAPETMNTSQRLCLAFTLCLLLFGLAVHAVPSVSSCTCVEIQNDKDIASGFDACLVCQLQSGLIETSFSSLFSDSTPSGVNKPANSAPLEHADQISHPPILS